MLECRCRAHRRAFLGIVRKVGLSTWRSALAMAFTGLLWSCGPNVADLTCPEGTRYFDAKPPFGNTEYCVVEGKTGPRKSPFKHGPARYWWPGGVVRSVGQYENNLRTGTFEWWYSDGTRASKGDYRNGSKTGVWTEWSRDGSLMNETPYVRGKIHGERKVFGSDGRPRMVYIYQGGRLVSERAAQR